MSPAALAAGRTGFDRMWAELAPVGRDAGTGGYRRFAWGPAELACREWFTGAAGARGLAVETDRNGNLWAWGGPDTDGPSGSAVVTGSHLDSVPDGGAFDGPLGIVTAFAALDALTAAGWCPAQRFAIVAFAEEEGARFGVPCAGSRLLTGALDPDRARSLRDGDGTTLAEALRGAGADPQALGPDPDRLAGIAAFVEVHVEQGRGLGGGAHPVAVGSGIWPHGRWRLTFRGAADHAGTTGLADRADPMLPFAGAVLDARALAARSGARATVGKVQVAPNGSNAIASEVACWLDARAPAPETVRALVADLAAAAGRRAERDGVVLELAEESWSPAVSFAPDLTRRLIALLGQVPTLPTGAGHDAGMLAAAGVPAAMLFVRNPTGVSHAPAEHAEAVDCHAGVAALAAVLADLTGTQNAPR